jgi:hypothetical protein
MCVYCLYLKEMLENRIVEGYELVNLLNGKLIALVK